MARMARHHQDQLAHIDRLTASRGRQERRLLPCAVAGDGGIEPRSGSHEDDLRNDQRLPGLHVLDSTDPAQVQTFENKVDLKNTLFIVSSKSGSTLEPNIFKQYFFDRVDELVGAEGSRPSLRRHHRSGLEAAADRRTRRLSAHLPRLAEYRRALLGSLRFRPGPGGHHGRGCGEVPGPDRGDGVCLHAVRSCCRKSRRRARHDPRRGGAGISAATK